MDRAFVMYKEGLRYFNDVWDPSPNDFLKWVGSRLKFFLSLDYMDFCSKLVERYKVYTTRILFLWLSIYYIFIESKRLSCQIFASTIENDSRLKGIGHFCSEMRKISSMCVVYGLSKGGKLNVMCNWWAIS
jgi:hypothetical protein